MAAVRRADATWTGDLPSGKGVVSADTSGAFKNLDVSWASRSEPQANGRTSPEELVAAAHAGCFAMSLAAEISKLHAEPRRVSVEATCVMDEVEGKGHLVVASNLHVRADVPGLDEQAFREAVERADAGCPISALIRGSAAVSVAAELSA
jgi:osmotically inducible protein OsmC